MTAVPPVHASTSGDPTHSVAPISAVEARRALNVRFGVDDGNDVALGHAHRPTWRGRIHTVGLVIAVPAAIALLVSSTGGARLRLGLLVYAVGLCSMFGASATYHRWVHGLRARSAWRRVDHAAIFAAIAGSSTPIALGAVAVPWLWAREGIGPTAFVALGGGFYLVGAAFFAKRWLTLRPTVFSYHEVWHAFTVIAALAQFVAIWMLATG